MSRNSEATGKPGYGFHSPIRSAARATGAPRRRRGFSLVELLVSLVLFTTVIMVPMYLLFTMRNYAEKQQFTIVPRQAARRAVDYISYYVEGASDLNPTAALPSPNAVITYFNRDASNPGIPPVQASYDNLTAGQAGAGYGDEGTDIISFAIPSGPEVTRVPIVKWPADGTDQVVQLTYRGGCGGPLGTDDLGNMQRFMTVTGAAGIPARSGLLTAVDPSGNWVYFRITSYDLSSCADLTGKNITVKASPGKPTASPDFGPIDVPSGHTTLGDPALLMVGLKFVSFRVRNGNLEQKNGIFSPVSLPDLPEIGNADIGTAPGQNTNFFTVMENIQDLQVAYLYGNVGVTSPMFPNGGIWNTPLQTFADQTGIPSNLGIADGVPPQAGVTSGATAADITHVIGLRISVLGRSAPMSLGAKQITHQAGIARFSERFRPAIENHLLDSPIVYDDSERYRATTTILLRNRILGS